MAHYCYECDRYFNTISALQQHMSNSINHPWYCPTHHADFDTRVGLKEHWVQSLDHDYCQHCDIHFEDEEDLHIHFDENHYWCSSCNKFFINQKGLEEHYRQSPRHHYCVPCKRHFVSASNLAAHLNSSIHTPKNYMCPAKGCGLKFVSQSAVVLHLEAGTCKSGIDRAKLNKFVRENDRNNLVTDPSRLLTGGNMDRDVKYYATDAAWDGYAYECYLCYGTYRSLAALNQHLASPRHQEKIYICRWDSCKTRFTTLSALCQHIESERCGISKFGPARRAMDGFVRSTARITYQ